MFTNTITVLDDDLIEQFKKYLKTKNSEFYCDYSSFISTLNINSVIEMIDSFKIGDSDIIVEAPQPLILNSKKERLNSFIQYANKFYFEIKKALQLGTLSDIQTKFFEAQIKDFETNGIVMPFHGKIADAPINKLNDKLVIFDWGGVIESHHKDEYNIMNAWDTILNRLKCEVDVNTLYQMLCECEIDINGIHIGETIKNNDIFSWFIRIKHKFGFECTFDEFVDIYKTEFDKVYYYNNVVNYAHSLKKHCKIGILSNLMLLDISRIHRHMDFSQFDYHWLSCETGIMKPNHLIYEKIENESGFKSKNILFIDDMAENISMAKNYGWNTCMATGHELDKIINAITLFLSDILDN